MDVGKINTTVQPNAVFNEGRIESSNDASSAPSKEEITQQVEAQKSRDEMKQELMDLAKQLNDVVTPLNTDIQFGFSDDISALYLNVVDTKTNDVIRQMPSEEAIELMTRMREFVGMLFDKRG